MTLGRRWRNEGLIEGVWISEFGSLSYDHGSTGPLREMLQTHQLESGSSAGDGFGERLDDEPCQSRSLSFCLAFAQAQELR